MSVHAYHPHRAPVVVRLPGQIDQVNLQRAYDQLYAAFVSGASVVIADLTATMSCDAACLRQLTAVQRRAAAQNAQLRLVIPSGSPLRRLAQLARLDGLIPVYPSLGRAAAADIIASRLPAPAPARSSCSAPGLSLPACDQPAGEVGGNADTSN